MFTLNSIWFISGDKFVIMTKLTAKNAFVVRFCSKYGKPQLGTFSKKKKLNLMIKEKNIIKK